MRLIYVDRPGGVFSNGDELNSFNCSLNHIIYRFSCCYRLPGSEYNTDERAYAMLILCIRYIKFVGMG